MGGAHAVLRVCVLHRELRGGARGKGISAGTLKEVEAKKGVSKEVVLGGETFTLSGE